jgi:HTH-type transcriptional regulator/antitoxin HipB
MSSYDDMEPKMYRIRTVRDLGNTIRGRRLDRGWTQAELADRARVSRSWVIDVEAAKKPTAEIGRILRLLDALGVDLVAATPMDTSAVGTTAAPVDLDAHLDRYRS